MRLLSASVAFQVLFPILNGRVEASGTPPGSKGPSDEVGTSRLEPSDSQIPPPIRVPGYGNRVPGSGPHSANTEGRGNLQSPSSARPATAIGISPDGKNHRISGFDPSEEIVQSSPSAPVPRESSKKRVFAGHSIKETPQQHAVEMVGPGERPSRKRKVGGKSSPELSTFRSLGRISQPVKVATPIWRTLST